MRSLFLCLCAVLLAACSNNNKQMPDASTASEKSYAVYAEYAKDSNVVMKNGLNRRMFDTVEARYGSKINLEKDGSITLQAGTYRLVGFSMVTMQTGFAPPVLLNNTNYPGYGIVYYRRYENDRVKLMQHRVAIGSPGTAFDTSPSLFDAVFTCQESTSICVGHQSGDSLHNEVYLSVFDVDGETSPYHVFARIAIHEL